MRNERHQALQRGSLREVSRVPSFLGKSRSEEESVFISPLPVASSRPFRRHNRSARKSLTRGKVCDLFFSMRILLVDSSRSSLHLPTCASAANTLPTRSRSCRSTPARCSVASAGDLRRLRAPHLRFLPSRSPAPPCPAHTPGWRHPLIKTLTAC